MSNYTLGKDRRLLHRLFVLADRTELREGNPVARVPSSKPDPRDPVLLREDQLEGLLGALAHHPMARAYVLLLSESGARCESEALHLRWEDVRLDEGFLWLASGRDGHRTKSGKGRWVPLTSRLRQALQEHAAQFRLRSQSPWVFHLTRGSRRGQRAREYRTTVKAAAKRAGLPGAWRLHDLRHRRVTTWLTEGKNPVHVKEAMGHSTIQVTMGYTHLAREHLLSLVNEPKPPTELRELAR